MKKNDLTYETIKLPKDIENKCLKLLDALNLKFGCIDLVKKNNIYYFMEINPAGEWDWLMYKLKLDIDVKIAEVLSNE